MSARTLAVRLPRVSRQISGGVRDTVRTENGKPTDFSALDSNREKKRNAMSKRSVKQCDAQPKHCYSTLNVKMFYYVSAQAVENSWA